MTDTENSEVGQNDSLKNPMRFALRNRTLDMENWLRHPDFDDKQVTEIDLRPSEGNVYVHWEYVAEDTEM